MAKRRKNKSTSTNKPRLRQRFTLNLGWIKSLDWHVAKRSTMGLAWLIAIAAIVGAWTLGVPRLEAFASQRGSVDPNDVTIRFIDPPTWIQGALSDSLLRTATMQVGGDPLLRNDLVAVRQSLLNTGWFNSVDQVRRVQPDLVEIAANFVRPYTLIHDATGHHLIDIGGKLLPKSYSETDDLPLVLDGRTGSTVPMIIISGVHFKRPQIGQQWEGTDVSAALKLMQLLERQPWRGQIAEIDVSSFLRDGPIRLRTDSASEIVWGGPPGEEAALELLAHGKIQRLTLLYQNHGRIDANRSGELDITGEKVVVAR